MRRQESAAQLEVMPPAAHMEGAHAHGQMGTRLSASLMHQMLARRAIPYDPKRFAAMHEVVEAAPGVSIATKPIRKERNR